MFKFDKERMEKEKEINEMIGELLGTALNELAKDTKNKDIIFAKSHFNLENKIRKSFDLMMNKKLTDVDLSQLISLFEQMENLIDDIIKDK